MIYPSTINESYIEGVILHHKTCSGFFGQNIKKDLQQYLFGWNKLRTKTIIHNNCNERVNIYNYLRLNKYTYK